MNAFQASSLKSILESKNGLHLSVYLEKDDPRLSIDRQVSDALQAAEEFLRPVVSPEDLRRFLDPVEGLLGDARLLRQVDGNVGLFRTFDSFRMLRLPVDVERITVVADTFHVKPLLKWKQIDREFLLVGVEAGHASLYQGSLHALRYVDSVQLGDIAKREQGVSKAEELTEWLNEWIFKLTRCTHSRIYVAGEPRTVHGLFKRLRYVNVHRENLNAVFRPSSMPGICENVRALLQQEARQTLEHALVEFFEADELNLTQKSIFQVARSAVQGNVKKLIVAEGINVFGRIDRKTGDLSIHPADLDHEDDDLLD
ncbi:MAG TPA: hypothetical protein VFV50_19465, partial [Bdellovibrionales bacterium]|nr:hypothetical protein [Bdellovibrionales bacterium]